MSRAVVLLHNLPDGTWHYDWMLEPPGESGAGGAALVTFRVAEWGGRRFAASRLGDHRREYLEYQGPVSGGRGEVRRVAAGSARWKRLSVDEMEVEIDWEGGACVRYVGVVVGPGAWEFADAGAAAT